MRGGAKKHVGDLAPEITDGPSLDRNCSCLYVSAHGTTQMRYLSVVPPNTFVVFIGQSGFSTPVKHGAEWIFYADSREEYFKHIFNTYFREDSPDSAKKRPYAAQHVYVPGDIIPLLSLDFRSGDQSLWFKGVFECPTRDRTMFGIPPEMTLIPQLMELSKKPDVMKIIRSAKFIRSEKEWKEEQKKPLQAIVKKFIVDISPSQYDFAINLNLWFKNTKPITDFLDSYLLDHPDNLMKKGHKELLDDYHSYLSYVLTKVNPTTDKKYKFVIVSSCRPPTNFTIEYPMGHVNSLYSSADPAGLPKSLNKTRRFARRLSFATKPLPTCATTDDPPMNMTKIFNIVLALTAKYSNLKNYGEKEAAFIEDLYEAFFSGYALKRVKEMIRTKECMNLLADRSFAKYPILTDERPEMAHYRERFAELISAIHASFGEFLKGIHQDNPANTREMKTLGRMILDQSADETAGLPDPERWTIPDENRANILAAQQAFLPRIDNETAKRSASRRKSASTRRSASRNRTLKKNTRFNTDALKEWRIRWLKGIRNGASNSKQLDEWAKYRRTLTEVERKAQNAELKRLAKEKAKA